MTRRIEDRPGAPIWGQTRLWSLPEDHPQRILAQPRWRQRQWLREGGARAAALKNAPNVLMRWLLDGLRREPRHEPRYDTVEIPSKK